MKNKINTIGIIGLGKMGYGIGYRLVKAGFTVLGYDPNTANSQEATQIGIKICKSNEELAKQVSTIWLFVPSGTLVDTILKSIIPFCNQNSIIVDGGNSFFQDSIRRHNLLKNYHIEFIDCGTSGGIHGKENGFCLMIGGNQSTFKIIKKQCVAIATKNGYAYLGTTGSGHYVKMVHNGIEYALMQSYAEGLQILQKGHFKDTLSLIEITKLWNHGSVIRSWLLELTTKIFENHNQSLETINGSVDESGMGLWTVNEAQNNKLPVPLIEKALQIRKESQISGGDYSTKIVALMRNQFGGHAYKKEHS